jgi:thiol-disulfide isomerase/thioredoxin
MSENDTRVITELSVNDLQKLQSEMGNKVLIIKFGAEWCQPCKRIAPTYHAFINSKPSNIIFADIDVDDSLDLYMALKSHKMLKGIPAFFAFYGTTKRDKWFIPDDSAVGAEETQITQFLIRCQNRADKYNTN